MRPVLRPAVPRRLLAALCVPVLLGCPPRPAAAQTTRPDTVRPAATGAATGVTPPATTTTTTTTAPTLPAAPGASTTGPAAADSAPVVVSVLTPRRRMGQRIRLRTRHVDAWAKAGNHDPAKLVLYLDGRPMKGATVTRVSPATPEVWEARLRRDTAGMDAWEALLGAPDQMVRNVSATLGPPVGPQFAADSVRGRVDIEIVRQWWFYGTVALWLAMLGLFVYLARRTGIIRDSPAPPEVQPQPDPPGPADAGLPGNPARERRRAFTAERAVRLEQRPYSLARFQMAVWFFVVTAAFLGIWLITGEFAGIITPQVLVLLGLSTTAAVGARVVEARRRAEQEAAAARVRQLRRDESALRATGVDAAAVGVREIQAHRAAVLADTPAAPVSRKFFHDILNENDEIALHRFQHFAWTLILAFIFLHGAYQTLALPALDNFLMILLGISGLTYVGFKAAENQS